VSVAGDIAIVLVFVLIGGFFAGAEMALVSLREGQIRSLRSQGRRGRRAARLAQDPNLFLSAVQIGVTFCTLLSGALGADLLAGDLKTRLLTLGLPRGLASPLAVVAVTAVISYFSLVLGELTPKRLALQRPEAIATFSAPVLDGIAVAARPVVWLLSRSVNLVVEVLGGNPRAARDSITSEELRELVVTGPHELGADERHIVSEVFEAGKRQLREVFLPRTEVEFIDADTPLFHAARIAAAATHSRFPVYKDSYDNVIGFVHVRDLLDPSVASRSIRVGEVARPVKMLPASRTVLSALSEMRRDRSHLAIVADEYGGTAGIVTLEDLVEELVGEIRDEYDVEAEQARRLRGGQLEVGGLLNLTEFAEATGIELPEGPYETVAGFVIARLGKLPATGESVEVDGRRLIVTEMDGRRIARVRVTPAESAGPGKGAGQGDGSGDGPGGPAPATRRPASQPAGAPDQPDGGQAGVSQQGVSQPGSGQQGSGQQGSEQQGSGQQGSGRPGAGGSRSAPAGGRPGAGDDATRSGARGD
jgi:putative hemolysin